MRVFFFFEWEGGREEDLGRRDSGRGEANVVGPETGDYYGDVPLGRRKWKKAWTSGCGRARVRRLRRRRRAHQKAERSASSPSKPRLASLLFQSTPSTYSY
jgi:hypothetical protein